MRGAVAALAAVSAALHKYGVVYVTMGTHADGSTSVNIQVGSDEQLAIVTESLGLPAARRVRSNESHWQTSSGMVGDVHASAYGAHRPLAEIAAIDPATVADAADACARAAEDLNTTYTRKRGDALPPEVA